ncbi:hypothetical protein HRbin28_02507 [bacterium HR28]|nr:hypothetical protein HRbin28_02507 [bacterium HR28]
MAQHLNAAIAIIAIIRPRVAGLAALGRIEPASV